MAVLKKFIQENLERYDHTQGLLPEKLEEFGDEFKKQGFLTRDQFYKIAYESSTRSAYHVKKNSEDLCHQVSSNVLEVNGDFSKIQLLSGLKGFKAPTASCVLTALNPSKHAVVDTRVWASLERMDYLEGRKESFGSYDYVKMIEPIRKISKETGFKCSEVGYALFAYDVEAREGTLH